ncbi:MAG TPA: HlyD family efflux transporter periplasmic adaptor subunit, partial [Paracoccaceae bacterium]|nr:HlyD family efflux transporter periplasmic adaptor subunit [Paracoccaceae bacterium]
PPGGAGPAVAVAVLDLPAPGPGSAAAALRDLYWASGWLSARAADRQATLDAARATRVAQALDILAQAGEHAKPTAAALAVVNATATALAADQAALGLLRGARTAPRIRLAAMSHAAWFRRRSTLAESLEAAMDECFDQGAAVALPVLPSTARAISVAHADHLRHAPSKTILSVPLTHAEGIAGVLSFERRAPDRPFTDEDRLLAEAVAALLGPLVEARRRGQRWIGGRLVDGFVHVLGVLLGPRRLSWKLLAVALVALAVAAATVQGPFRLQAEAALRGSLQRAAVAPFAGYVAEAPVRAGDRVTTGDLLVRLDDADLRLEELRWRSEIDRLRAQARTALARGERDNVGLIEAQVSQARAQLDLAALQLARARVTAPIDGLVVAGDLSQRLGAPVSQGEVLFEIAPDGDWRLDIWIDERDLPHAAEGQRGTLALTGAPDAALPFTVTRITPVAEAREGANTFRAEARIDGAPDGLRPGMEGVARVEAGRALMAWVWTRRLADWARRTVWAWTP